MLRFTYKKNYTLGVDETSKKALRFRFFKDAGDEKQIDETSKELKRFIVPTYQDLLKILRKEYYVQFEKIFYNLISDDGEYFTIIRKSPVGGEMVLLYKFENESVKKVIKEVIGNENSVSFGSLENSYIWCMVPDLLETLITAQILRDTNVELYEEHHKKKKNGKVRTYYAPNEYIKACLRKLNMIFQRVYDSKNEDFQVAYKKGKSVYNNAEIHRENKYVFNLDLKDFYPSCKKELVRKYIEFLFNSVPGKTETMEDFLDIITINDGLFIGSPVSGCLANAILSQAVKYIKNICLKNGMQFSIYADDMTFSSNKKLKRDKIERIFNEAFVTYHLDGYFTLNNEKAIGYTGMNRKITGISINNNNQLTTKRRYYRELRVMIDHLSKGDTTNIDINKLRGKIAYATMVDDSGKFYNYLLKFMPTVKKYKLCSDEKLAELKEKFE